RDAPRVLGRLALGVREISGDGDHRLGDRRPEVVFSFGLKLLQDLGGDLLRRVETSAQLYLVIRPHLSLDGDDRAVRVGDRLPLGDLPYQPLAVLGESDDRRRRTGTFRVGDDDRFAAL